MYNTIIFDVDGTLLDTRPGIISAVKSVIDKNKLKQLSNEELNLFVGRSPIQEAFHYFCGTDEFMSQRCAEEYRFKYKQGDIFNATVYHGIFKLLDLLNHNKYKLGIATYKRQDNIKQLSEKFGFNKYFDSICGADNDNKLTKSDIILKCLKRLGSDISTTIMIGDSCHDAEAANKLKIAFIGVTYGFGFKNELDLIKYKPLLVAKNVYDIEEFFKKIRR